MVECAIVGGGPAGLSAALYLARKKMNISLISLGLGGQIADAPTIENYPAIETITGAEWVQKATEQVEKLKIDIKTGAKVTSIKKIDDYFEINILNKGKVQAKSVLITSGKTPRSLGVPGESEYVGKGISVCVTCDGPLFNGKDVAVIGGGNSAICSAMELMKYANKVYILHLEEKMMGEEIRIEELQNSPKVEILNEVKVTEIFGGQLVEGLKYKSLKTNEEKSISCQGIFVEIGWEPSTDYLKGFLKLNDNNEVIVDAKNATSVPGIFAAGDVTESPFKQLVIAAGEGAKAALSVWEYVTGKK